ncbi:hypothetical protein NLI96_g663 [Meripilus lineatus]|uniref:Uncharacterized protein n=1 Tax=Meripilus lineatus TaxID=2056292 RepID=A0AAD5YLS1_9APHY|nr:hypothetical protein NLI96_g663 [Physisporinus lineatus]
MTSTTSSDNRQDPSSGAGDLRDTNPMTASDQTLNAVTSSPANAPRKGVRRPKRRRTVYPELQPSDNVPAGYLVIDIPFVDEPRTMPRLSHVRAKSTRSP